MIQPFGKPILQSLKLINIENQQLHSQVHIQKKWQKIYSKILPTNIYSNIIHNSPKVGPMRMSITSWAHKQNMVFIHNRNYSATKRIWNPNTCYNVNEPRIHYARRKKPDIKDYLMQDSIHIKCPKKTNL